MTTLDTTEVKNWVKNQGGRENARRMLLTLLGQDAVSEIKKQILDSGSYTTGQTSSSISYEVKDGYTEVTGSGYVTNAIETGRMAGKMPPINALKRWSRLKLGNENAAYLVARKIAREGTRAKGLISKSLQTVVSEIFPARWAYLSKRWTS